MDIDSRALDQPASRGQSTPAGSSADGGHPDRPAAPATGSANRDSGAPAGDAPGGRSPLRADDQSSDQAGDQSSGAGGARADDQVGARSDAGSPSGRSSGRPFDSASPSDSSGRAADSTPSGGGFAASSGSGGPPGGPGESSRSVAPPRPEVPPRPVPGPLSAQVSPPAPRRRTAGPAGSGPQLDPAVPALLIRLDWNPAHHATLGVIRSLGRAGVPVHAVLENGRVPSARSRYLTGAHSWLRPELGSTRPAELVDRLCRLAERVGGQPVLYPMDDAGALLLAEHGAPLTEFARFPAVTAAAPARVADKARLAELCRAAGIAQPDTRIPVDAAGLAATVAELGLPLIAKWSRPWLLRPGSGLRSTALVTRAAEAELLFARRAEAGCELLLQRWIPATAGGDRFFHGYFTRAAGSGGAVGALADGPVVCRFGASGRKDLAWPRGAGLTARGTWLPEPAVEAAACRVVEAAGFTGVVDLDFRLDPTTGRYVLLDFNPRLGAQFRLFTDPTGLDLPRAVHLDLTGRGVPPLLASPGRRLTVETYDPLGALRPGRGLERAWFARDDPAPFPAAVLGGATRLLRRNRPGSRSAAHQRPAIQGGDPS